MNLGKLYVVAILLSLFLVLGCATRSNEGSEFDEGKRVGNSDKRARIVEVDSCEYVVITGSGVATTTHHKDCRFCKERGR